MAFVHQQLGAQLAQNPQAAFDSLAALFQEHKTREAVAKAVGANARTLARWISKLVESGLGDPRGNRVPAEEKKIAKKPRKKPAKKAAGKSRRKKVVAH